VQDTLQQSRAELFQYFHEMAVKRRAQPSNDIVSLVANGSVNGRPLEPIELLSYYFLLALFPLLLVLINLLGYVAQEGTGFRLKLISYLAAVMPSNAVTLVQTTLDEISASSGSGKLSLGLLAALWAASNGMGAISQTLNTAYNVRETRSWWKVRLVAIGLTVGTALFILSALSLVLVGPTVAESLGRATGWGKPFEWTWLILQWPLILALVATGIGLVYYFGLDADQDWTWITPGAVAATVLWLVVSLLFKFYVATFTDYNGAYGAVGGVIVLLLWFYLSGLALLVGAELNAEIEHASPYGKAPGQRNPQGRLLLGARAARAFQLQHAAIAAPTATVSSAPPQPSASPGLGAAALAGALLLSRLWNRIKSQTLVWRQ
jgi:membrane protein